MKFLQSLILFSVVGSMPYCAALDSTCDAAAMPSAASTSSCDDKKPLPADILKETDHIWQGKDKKIPYKATVGTLTIKDCKEDPKAQIFYIAYTKSDETDTKKRPITFCFNGGPGSSSVWLHMGAFGPKRVLCTSEGSPVQPFQLTENQYSILDVTDLVFIDPVATGFSRPLPGQDPKQFFGVKQDIESVAEFIRLYTTKNTRWQSPKILAGESYGTTRAAGLSSYLQSKMFMSVDGVILISSVLNWQTINITDEYIGNDLPCALSLPSFAATAWFFKKAGGSAPLDQFLAQVEQFASGDYTLALMKGSELDDKQRNSIAEKLSSYTGLTKEYILCADLRPDMLSFAKQILKSEQKVVSVYDARIEGIDLNPCDSMPSYDPSLDLLTCAFSSSFNDYVKTELGWDKDTEYKILADVFPWNYEPAINQFLNVATDLRDTMTKNTYMKVFVASGLFDLVTPYFATEYTLDHMQLNSSLKGNVTRKFYPGGHMMYLNEPNLQNLKGDLSVFYSKLRQPVKE